MNRFKEAAELIKNSKYMVALTGAGVSTDSGIPDFRSNRGYYSFMPEEALSTQVLHNDPRRFYREGYTILKDLDGKKPNKTHQILTKFQDLGFLHEIITQNIDNLHQLAGNREVLPVHGNAGEAHCESCTYTEDFIRFNERIEKGVIPPTCPECGGLLRTSVVLFGDAMPPAFEQALSAVSQADTMLVIGSSLSVMPVAYLPSQVENLIIINRDETPFDNRAKFIFHENASSVMENIYNELKGE